MTHSEAGKLGAQISGPRLREKALKKYYENPSVCLECGNIIKVESGKSPSSAREKRFCGHHCSAIYNNTRRIKKRNGLCTRCGNEIESKSRYTRKYCDTCYPIQQRENRRTIGNLTKKELKERCKSYPSFKVIITNDANSTYKAHKKPMICNYCGYSLHTEICHIKDVKDFADDALIEEINHPDNLVALCRNHHWEFDNNYIQIKSPGSSTIEQSLGTRPIPV